MRIMLSSVVLALVSCGGGGTQGEVECSGADCVCPGTGDCLVDCISDCNLQCAGSGRCDFECGAGCDVACTGSGPCIVTVGDDSNVSCPGSGGCDVACNGDCNVACPGSGDCIVRCAPGAVCNISMCSGSVTSCPDGISVCGGPCP
jgi:hypothetical protein